ncbi:MAG: EI24 domain-containing protein [Sphingomonas sp.]|uniref:EI24 domain-containing protein n=1 Tax=Sphingomonas sp. TaxID=28214 RepID=UPI001ACD7E80|nr:EI24 domain-containing protein [Sphingomonas sp.]MBN8807935.1 EI24 domain-containing protein [Sphingomonas sp.]
MIRAFFLSLGDLADPAILKVFAQSLALTLVLFLGLGAGGWFATRWLVLDLLNWGETAANLAAISGFVAMILFGWVLFRAIAVAVVWLFGDAIVIAVERRHYPAALASARPVGMARGLAIGVRSAARALLVNIVLAPLYVVLLVTGIGTPLLFFAANGWLLGADLGEMVAARHLDGPDLRTWRRATRWTRWDLGTMIAALLSVPFVNLVAPVLGAAMATHMFHGRRT